MRRHALRRRGVADQRDRTIVGRDAGCGRHGGAQSQARVPRGIAERARGQDSDNVDVGRQLGGLCSLFGLARLREEVVDPRRQCRQRLPCLIAGQETIDDRVELRVAGSDGLVEERAQLGEETSPVSELDAGRASGRLLRGRQAALHEVAGVRMNFVRVVEHGQRAEIIEPAQAGDLLAVVPLQRLDVAGGSGRLHLALIITLEHLRQRVAGP